MKHLYSFAALAALLFVLALPMHAQLGGGVNQGDGCDQSPENPTAILAIAGSAGAGIAYLRGRFSKKAQ